MCAHGRCCIHESVARPQFCTRGAADQVRAAARFVHVNRLAARRHRSANNPDGDCVGLQWQFSDRKNPRFQVRRARLAEPHRCLLQPSSRLVRPSPMPRPSEHAAIASTRVSYLPPDPVRRSLCSRLAEVAGRPMASMACAKGGACARCARRCVRRASGASVGAVRRCARAGSRTRPLRSACASGIFERAGPEARQARRERRRRGWLCRVRARRRCLVQQRCAAHRRATRQGPTACPPARGQR